MISMSLTQMVTLGSAAFGLVMLLISLFQMSKENWLKPLQSIVTILCYAFPTAILLVASQAAVNFVLGALFLGLGLIIGVFPGARIKLRGAAGGVIGSRSRFPTFAWSLASLATPLTALAGSPALFAAGAMGVLFGFGLVLASEGTLFFRLLFFNSAANRIEASQPGTMAGAADRPSGRRKGMTLAVVSSLAVMCLCGGLAAPNQFPGLIPLPEFLTSTSPGEAARAAVPSDPQNVPQQQVSPQFPPLETAAATATPVTIEAVNDTTAETAPQAGQTGQDSAEGDPGWQVVVGGENLAANAFWNQEGITASAGTLSIDAQDGYFMFINRDGPYLELSGSKDFGVRSTIENRSDGFGGVSIYAALPEGEWWKGVRRLDIGLDKTKVVIASWDGSGEGPIMWEEFQVLNPKTKMELAFYKEGDILKVVVDGNEVGQLELNGLLDADRIYFGVNVAPHTQVTIQNITIEAREENDVVVRGS